MRGWVHSAEVGGRSCLLMWWRSGSGGRWRTGEGMGSLEREVVVCARPRLPVRPLYHFLSYLFPRGQIRRGLGLNS